MFMWKRGIKKKEMSHARQNYTLNLIVRKSEEGKNRVNLITNLLYIILAL